MTPPSPLGKGGSCASRRFASTRRRARRPGATGLLPTGGRRYGEHWSQSSGTGGSATAGTLTAQWRASGGAFAAVEEDVVSAFAGEGEIEAAVAVEVGGADLHSDADAVVKGDGVAAELACFGVQDEAEDADWVVGAGVAV